MCRRLLAAGYSVTAITHGATPATTAAACAAGADVLLTSLPRPEHVESVMRGDQGALASLRPGTVWVDLTTNRKEL